MDVEMQPPAPRPWREVVPPAFVISVATTVIVGALFSIVITYGHDSLRYDRDPDTWLGEFVRYGRPLLSPGFALAAGVLSMLGFAELSRRAGPGLDGTFLRIGLVAAAVIVGGMLVNLYMRNWWWPRSDDREALETMQTFWKWYQRVGAAGALVCSGALLAAGRRHPLVQGLAMPFIIATAFAFPFEMVWELTHESDPSLRNLWLETFIDIAIDVSFAASLLMVVTAIGRSLPPPPVDLARAGDGLHRVGSALVARVLVIVVGAFTLMSTVGVRSPGLAKAMAVVFPFGMLLASIALVTGVLQTGGLASPGAPRRRFYAAAVLGTAALVAEALKAVAFYHHLSGLGEAARQVRFLDAERLLGALPYGVPALGLAAMLCLLSGVQAMRRWAPDARVTDGAISGAAISVTLFTILAVLMSRWAYSSPRDVGVFIIVSIMIAVANVIAWLSVARACHRVAESMRGAPALPTAVVKQRHERA
jgi:hypothetical protein